MAVFMVVPGRHNQERSCDDTKVPFFAWRRPVILPRLPACTAYLTATITGGWTTYIYITRVSWGMRVVDIWLINTFARARVNYATLTAPLHIT